MKSYLHLLLILGLFTAGFASLEAGATSFKNRIRIQKHSQLMVNDPETSEEFNAEKAELLAKKRRSLILDIKRFIREARSLDQKAELNLRLGGLYMEDYHAGLAKAQVNFEQETAVYSKNPKGKRPPRLDTSEALTSLDKARVIYRDLITRFPKHNRRDEMLYFLALSALDKGLTNEGMNYFKQLSDQMPNSKYVTESLVQLGDYYFENNKYSIAEGFYDKVIAKRDAKLSPYSIYKKGWCAYNTQRPGVTLQLFRAVIDREERDTSGSTLRLKNEAVRDIALPFADLKMTEEAIAFYRGQAEPHYRRGLETIAGLYLEKGDFKNTVFMNEHLLSIDANDPKNPSYDIAVVEALKLQGDTARSVNRLFSNLPNYMENSSWHEINAARPNIVKEAKNRYEEIARKYALEFHAEGQKTKNDKLYGVAKSLYEKYLEYFPQSTQAHSIRFFLAEILYKQNSFLAAADQYYLVYKEPSAGNMRLDSIRYAMNALDKELNLERKKAGLAEISAKSTTKLKDKEDAELQETPYTPVEVKFMNVSTEYLSSFPKAKDASEVLYQQAYLQYLHFDFGRAYKSFWQLIQTYPGKATTYSSAYLVLDILNRKKEYAKLVAACEKFLATNSFSKSDFKADVGNIQRRSDLKRIQLIEEKGDFKEAAAAYVEYTKGHGSKDESLFEKALYNASVNYVKAGLLMQSLETQERFLGRFKQSPLRENMLLQVAKTHESLAHFEKAANYFEQFATGYPKNPQSENALRLAGLYYWGSNNGQRAEGVMRSYLGKYTKNAKLVEKDLLNLYESQGQTDRQIRFYLEDRAQKNITYAQYLTDTLKIAELQGSKTGRIPGSTMEEALKISQKFRRDLMQTKAGVENSAKVYFWFANQKEDVLYRIKLALPQRQLELNLQRKLALLKELEKEYSEIAKMGGGEWGLGAIYKTAAAYRHMANEVSQAPVPAELSGEQLELYRAELKKQMIKPFNEKAVTLVGQCLDKAQEFNLLSKWTPSCYALGSELDPSRYPTIKSYYLPALRVAVLLNTGETNTTTGNMKRFAYPFESTGMFTPAGAQERTLASMGPVSLPSLFDGGRGLGTEGNRATPNLFTYRSLSEERREILGKAADSNRPDRNASFAHLHFLRLTNPQKAIYSIQEAIQKDPANNALHNLLGLAYMDMGNYPAARVTWLSMLARGIDSAEVINNLGVLSNLEGHESQAIEYFREAAGKEGSREASLNLGFLALKYRNGFEAKLLFEKAAGIENNDVATQVGLGVARLQNREFDIAKDTLSDAAKKFQSDPYAKLSYAYLLMDIEKEPAAAQQLLGEYAKSQSGSDSDPRFREAMQDTQRGPAGAGSAEGLPSLGN